MRVLQDLNHVSCPFRDRTFIHHIEDAEADDDEDESSADERGVPSKSTRTVGSQADVVSHSVIVQTEFQPDPTAPCSHCSHCPLLQTPALLTVTAPVSVPTVTAQTAPTSITPRPRLVQNQVRLFNLFDSTPRLVVETTPAADVSISLTLPSPVKTPAKKRSLNDSDDESYVPKKGSQKPKRAQQLIPSIHSAFSTVVPKANRKQSTPRKSRTDAASLNCGMNIQKSP